MVPSKDEKLNIEIVDLESGVRQLKLSGPLTLRTLFDFQEVSRRDPGKPVVVDVEQVPYMDSAGLGATIGLFSSCQRTKRGFGIIGIQDRIRTLFQVTGMDGILPTYPNLEAAEAAIRAE